MESQNTLRRTNALEVTGKNSAIERARFATRRVVNLIMAGLVGLAALLAVGLLLVILYYVVQRGFESFFVRADGTTGPFNFNFFTATPSEGGIGPAILGTLIVVGLGALIAIPIGVLAGVYLSEYGRGRFAFAVRFIADMLTGLPSIIVGVFVATLLVRNTFGHYSGLAGGIALAIIMAPIIARTVEEVLKLVPNALREASLALGVPQWKTIVKVVLPSAISGIITGVVLSIARAAGETAPLLLTILGIENYNGNNFIGRLNPMVPVGSLPTTIYTNAGYPPNEVFRISSAWGASLILITIILIFSLLARWATRGKKVR